MPHLPTTNCSQSATAMVLASQRILCSTFTTTPCAHRHNLNRSFLLPSSPSSSWVHKSFGVSASKKFSPSRTGRFDSKNRRSSVPTKDEEEEDAERTAEIGSAAGWDGGAGASAVAIDDGFIMPELPGEKPDFWEGPKWDAFGFFIQYMWAFGIVFALIACGIAVTTYNEGATDFKDTPVYKEAIQSRELLEEPEGSNSEVFESNPTEQAPATE